MSVQRAFPGARATTGVLGAALVLAAAGITAHAAHLAGTAAPEPGRLAWVVATPVATTSTAPGAPVHGGEHVDVLVDAFTGQVLQVTADPATPPPTGLAAGGRGHSPATTFLIADVHPTS